MKMHSVVMPVVHKLHQLNNSKIEKQTHFHIVRMWNLCVIHDFKKEYDFIVKTFPTPRVLI